MLEVKIIAHSCPGEFQIHSDLLGVQKLITSSSNEPARGAIAPTGRLTGEKMNRLMVTNVSAAMTKNCCDFFFFKVQMPRYFTAEMSSH